MFFFLPHRDVVRNKKLRSVQEVICFSSTWGSHLIKSVEEYLKIVIRAVHSSSVSYLCQC